MNENCLKQVTNALALSIIINKMQGFKNKPNKKAGKAHQSRKNKPAPKKALNISGKAHKKLTASIDANIEQICADRVIQTKQHLNIVKISDRSKVIRKWHFNLLH